jgi:DNA-binding Xre family transcriptional regulator
MRVAANEKYQGEPPKPCTKFEKAISERYTFHGPHSLWAVITVSENIGLLQIASDFGDWSYRWSSPGCPFKEFLVSLGRDGDYLINKLTGGACEANLDRTRARLKERIKEIAAESDLTPGEIEDLNDEAERIHGDSLNDICQSIYDSALIMEKVYQNDCYDVSEVVTTELPVMAVRFYYEIYVPWFVPELKKELGL